MELSYPPEPWELHGHCEVGVWLLPADEAPEVVGRPIRLFGKVIVLAAFLQYREPSPLVYNEVLATQLIRVGWRPRITITDIWVDSPASHDGGRALWSIPKHLAKFERSSGAEFERSSGAEFDRSSGAEFDRSSGAEFERNSGARNERYEAADIARLDTTTGAPWPWRLPVRFTLAQRDLADSRRVKSTSVTGWARPGRSTRARWQFDPDGPLSYLSNRKPRMSVRFGDFALTFGRSVPGS